MFTAGSVADAIERWSRDAAEAVALVSLDREISYASLWRQVGQTRAELAAAGLGRNDRVGLLVPPGIDGAQLAVALACNATLVPVNPALTQQEVIEFAGASGISAMVVPSWLDTPARSAPMPGDIPILSAERQPDGSLRCRASAAMPGGASRGAPPGTHDAALLLRSSGTTGAPKLIPVTHGNLLAMAGKLASGLWFGLSRQDRAACTLPLFYAAGLKTSLFVPLILGAGVCFPPAGRAFDLAAWVGALKPTYLSVSPAALNGILDALRARGGACPAHSLRFVMCAASYLPDDLRREAEQALRIPVLEFYGLSEAGVMAANPLPPGIARPGTVGLPSPGELRVVDEAMRPVANGVVGQIVISGPTVTPGYIGEGAAALTASGGWLQTGDLGRLDEDGYLTIAGRVKEVINRGGEKVFPYEIEKALLQHPDVLEAAAFGVPHPRLGESVAAAVVLRAGCMATGEALKDFLAGRLAPFKLPRRVSLVPTLPRGPTGKVLRSALTLAHAAARPPVVPADRLLELELRRIWARLLRTDDLGIDDDFFEQGGDSLQAAQLLVEVEALAGRPYPASQLSTLTIRHMAEVLAADRAGGRELMTQVRSGTGAPLFFCHGDYVSRGLYARALAQSLPGDASVFLLNCYADAPPGASIEQVAQAYLDPVLAACGVSPVFVGGYCNGGLAAWHLAHLLRLHGGQVASLLLVETLSLNARAEMRSMSRLAVREDAMRTAWAWRRRLGHFNYGALRRRIDRSLGPRRSLPERDDLFERADAVYMGLMSRYVPPAIDVDVTCFVAQDGQAFDTAARCWRSLAPSVTQVDVPGTHLGMLVSGRQALARSMGEVMARAAA